MDSTVERIRKAEGEEVWEDVFDPEALDPATVFRYVLSLSFFASEAISNPQRSSFDRYGNNRKCHA